MYYVQKEHHNLKIKSFTNKYKNKIEQSLTKGTQPFCVYRIRDSTKTAAPHRYIYKSHWTTNANSASYCRTIIYQNELHHKIQQNINIDPQVSTYITYNVLKENTGLFHFVFLFYWILCFLTVFYSSIFQNSYFGCCLILSFFLWKLLNSYSVLFLVSFCCKQFGSFLSMLEWFYSTLNQLIFVHSSRLLNSGLWRNSCM